MDEFEVSWLDTREAADVRARNISIVNSLREFLDDFEQINVVDLGAGTGALFRYLAPRLSGCQTWRLVDRSDNLLRQSASRLVTWADAKQLTVGGSKDLWCASNAREEYCLFHEQKDFGRGLADFSFHSQIHLITASALLDLVSLNWIEELIALCSRIQASFYGSLTYDGKIDWLPSHPSDIKLLRLLNKDQRRDKGLGPALGPDSIVAVKRCLALRGFVVSTAPSPWILGAEDADLQKALLSQWSALLEQNSDWNPHEFRLWRKFRLEAIARGKSQLTVGHQDIWAVPPPPA
jgi:hypothetical protein